MIVNIYLINSSKNLTQSDEIFHFKYQQQKI